MIGGRLKAALGRKSVPICYGMHLTELMRRAGVDLSCAGDKEEKLSSAIDHHTLKRLGYRREVATWTYVGRGKVNTDLPAAEPREDDIEEEGEEQPETTAQAESAAPSHPPQQRFPSSHHSLRAEIAHLRNFMVEQFQFLQATLMSKLDSIETRVQACEEHLGHHTRQSPPPTSTDPKGKAPMVSPIASPIPSPLHSPYHSPIPSPIPSIPSPSPSPLQQIPPTEPVPIPSSSSSSSSDSQHFELTARTPPAPTKETLSSDSEATPSDPARFVPEPPSPPSPISQAPASAPATRTKQLAIKNPTFTPSPSSHTQTSPTEPSPPSPAQPAPTPQPTLTPQTTQPNPSVKPAIYTRRKLAVSRPGASTPPPPKS